jgi:hypothetical protein
MLTAPVPLCRFYSNKPEQAMSMLTSKLRAVLMGITQDPETKAPRSAHPPAPAVMMMMILMMMMMMMMMMMIMVMVRTLLLMKHLPVTEDDDLEKGKDT